MRLLGAGPRHRPWAPRPRRHTPRTPPLPASLHERNTAPARHPTAWLTPVVKEISPLLAQNEQNTALFSVPGRRIFHGTPPPFTQGRFFFHPSHAPAPQAGHNWPCAAPSVPTWDKTRPARTTPQSTFFTSRANCVSVPLRIHSCRASFILPTGAAARTSGLSGALHAGGLSVSSRGTA